MTTARPRISRRTQARTPQQVAADKRFCEEAITVVRSGLRPSLHPRAKKVLDLMLGRPRDLDGQISAEAFVVHCGLSKAQTYFLSTAAAVIAELLRLADIDSGVSEVHGVAMRRPFNGAGEPLRLWLIDADDELRFAVRMSAETGSPGWPAPIPIPRRRSRH